MEPEIEDIFTMLPDERPMSLYPYLRFLLRKGDSVYFRARSHTVLAAAEVVSTWPLTVELKVPYNCGHGGCEPGGYESGKIITKYDPWFDRYSSLFWPSDIPLPAGRLRSRRCYRFK
jgi:hypothetical protein